MKYMVFIFCFLNFLSFIFCFDKNIKNGYYKGYEEIINNEENLLLCRLIKDCAGITDIKDEEYHFINELHVDRDTISLVKIPFKKGKDESILSVADGVTLFYRGIIKKENNILYVILKYRNCYDCFDMGNCNDKNKRKEIKKILKDAKFYQPKKYKIEYLKDTLIINNVVYSK